MRVLIATPLYPPEIGGPATHAAFLERELPEYGFQVSVLPFSFVRHLPPGIRHCMYAVRLFRMGLRADLIFAEDTVSVGFPASLVAFILRRNFVVRIPGDHAWEQGRQRFGVTDSLDDFQHKRYGWRVELMRRIARSTVRSADLVIVPSNYFKSIVAGWLPDVKRLRVIYNGIDLEGLSVKPARVPGKPCMVSAGRLVPWKGFGTLIELLPSLPSWSLVIIGDGPLRAELEATAKAFDVSERITFTGPVTREEVLGWYAVADAFVLNSSFESFSYQIVEALSAGIPVIATNIGSIPELVTSGEEGILVAPDATEAFREAILSVGIDAAWGRMKDAARKKALVFSSERTAEETANALKELETRKI